MNEKQPLMACPSSPNCILSLKADEKHSIEPYHYESTNDIWVKLKTVIDALPRTELVKEENDYLHYIFKTKVFGFKDDVEIWHDKQNKTIHFRSASRIGYSDMGTNRRRVENIKSLLAE